LVYFYVKFLFMQHEYAAWTQHIHAAWTRTMGMHMKHGYGHAAWTFSCSMDVQVTDISIQHDKDMHGHEHTTWTWTCSMGRDMQHDRNMQHAQGHATWT
jgi:hypothetical protein